MYPVQNCPKKKMGQNVPGTKCPNKKGKNVPGTKSPTKRKRYKNVPLNFTQEKQ